CATGQAPARPAGAAARIRGACRRPWKGPPRPPPLGDGPAKLGRPSNSRGVSEGPEGPPKPPNARRRPRQAGPPLEFARRVRGPRRAPKPPVLGDAPASSGLLRVCGLTADFPAGQALEHLDDRGSILFAEPGPARHLVDLLAHVRQQERRPELLGEGRLELLVLERDVDGASRREIAREHPGRAALER